MDIKLQLKELRGLSDFGLAGGYSYFFPRFISVIVTGRGDNSQKFPHRIKQHRCADKQHPFIFPHLISLQGRTENIIGVSGGVIRARTKLCSPTLLWQGDVISIKDEASSENY